MKLIIVIICILIICKMLIKPFIILNKIKLEHFTLITGGVGSGKSTLAIYFALLIFYYQRKIIIIENIVRKILRKEIKELPLLYSNIPIANKYGYAPLTKDILLRKAKPIEKSILYIGEFSLVADSMNFKDMILNEQIMLFFKLFRHEFKGRIIVDTQNVSDCHFAVKKITNNYIWIERGRKGLFSWKMNIRKLYYNYDNANTVNTLNSKDIEKDTMEISVNKSIWKKFDSYVYSELTKNLPIKRNNIPLKEIKTLKQNYIVSFNKWLTDSLGETTNKEIDKELLENGKQIKQNTMV